MSGFLRLSLSCIATLCLANSAFAQLNILTNRYNQARTAANLAETTLTTSNVYAGNFGKLGTYAVDGIIYAMPLYVQGITVNGATHNVLIVATMHNVLYAFDADKVGSSPLWTLDLRTLGYTPWPVNSTDLYGVSDTFGILSTPVIDLANNRIFLVTHSVDTSNNVNFTLFNVNLQTGGINQSAPISITVPAVGAANSVSIVPPNYYTQRPALELADGQLWVGFGSRAPGDENAPWHGFVATYNPSTLAQTGVVATSRSSGGSIWQSGGGPAVDASGNVFYTTGNGNNDYDGVYEFPETLLKLNYGSALTLTDWYTPDSASAANNYVVMNNYDLDLSVCGPMLIPGTDLIALGSKTADVYLLHSSQPLGHLTPNDTQVAQMLHVGIPATAIDYSVNESDRLVGLAFWPQSSGGYLYAWAGLSALHQYSLNTATTTFNLANIGNLTIAGQPSAAISISANGTTANTGILWATHTNTTTEANAVGVPGILHAYNAATLQELWNSTQVGTDAMGTVAKFVPPVVANGRVYLANSGFVPSFTGGSVTVFGLLNAAAPPGFSIAPASTVLKVAQNSSAADALTVTPTNGFSGTVRYSVSGLPSGASASFSGNSLTVTTTPAAALGTTVLTITGTSGSITAQTSVTLTITGAPTFTLSASPNAGTLSAGQTGSAVISLTPLNGFTGTVTYSVTGFPANTTASFSPASSTGGSTLSASIPAAAAGGSYPLIITGTSGSLTAQTSIALTIIGGVTAPPPSFTLAANPSVGALARGQSGAAVITLTPVNGFSGTVKYTVTGLPAGATSSFSPASSTGGTTISATIPSNAAVGTYSLVVTATAATGGTTASTTIKLTIS